METTRKTCRRVNDDYQLDTETIQENCQSVHDAGEKETMDENRPNSLIMEIYPWIMQFKKMCRSLLSQRSMNSLMSLMMFYTRKVRPSVNECHTKPLRAEKFKDSIGEALLFFLYYYREIGDDKDRDAYLILMSDLLAMYIDMELKASKKGKEHCSKISARLSSCLHVYLEHSTEYLLDTLLKIHFITHNYQDILDPVITKIFKSIEEHPSSSIMYVRYLLAFRLWKKLNKDMAVRNQINLIAITSLGPTPTDFPPFILESVLPKVPKSQKLSTKLLLVHKFDVEKSCQEFLNFCKKEREVKFPKMVEDESRFTSPITTSLPEDNNDTRCELIIKNNLSNVHNQVNSSLDNLSKKKSFCQKSLVTSNSSSVKKTIIPVKLSSLNKCKKFNDIVFIDLTCESVTEKIIRKKKTRRKLNWLEEAKKRCINPKINDKKQDSSIEDRVAPAMTLQPEDRSLDVDCLRITSTKSSRMDMEIVVERVDETLTREERVVGNDSLHALSTSTPTTLINDDKMCNNVTNLPTIISKDYNHKDECDNLEMPENEKNHIIESAMEKCELLEKVAPTITQVASIQMQVSTTLTTTTTTATTTAADNSTFDKYLSVNRIINEKREKATRGDIVETPQALCELAKALKDDKTLVAHSEPVIRTAIKAERVTNEESNEIINDELPLSGKTEEVNVVEYASEVTLQTTCRNKDEELCTSKINEGEFQENIDGLALLASVSQSISHLTTSQKVNELIKVKNYASLVNSNDISEPDTSFNALPSSDDSTSRVINRIIGIHAEDAMDKVAYQVEVSSTDEIDPYETSHQFNDLVKFSNNDEICRNSQTQSSNDVVPVESTTMAEKDDTNVILNGETVVLFQKSPNSNLYIINKAVENRDIIIDDSINPHRDLIITDHINQSGQFPYDIYDNRYRNQASSYDISQYNREYTTQESMRVKNIKVDSTIETSEACENSLELAKPRNNINDKKTTADVNKSMRMKRKSSTNSPSLSSRRRHIKQEYNGCSSQSHNTNNIKTNYGIKDCPKEQVDQTRSIHIPVSHSSPLTSIYTKYNKTAGPEIYLPCHNNCNSITCGLPVNSPTTLYPHHGGKNSSSGNSHCSCLNCPYEIVAHCGDCHKMPNGETRMGSIDSNSYYLPLHSNVKNTNIQDCNITSIDDSLSKMYDNQLVCKFEEETMVDGGRQLESHTLKCEPKDIYRQELDNKLPLKKRFKAIMSMSFDEISIKREKNVDSYPGTPMLSIAALEAAAAAAAAAAAHDETRITSDSPSCEKNLFHLGSKLTRTDYENSHSQAREMIRRDYHRKDMIISSPPPPPPPQVPPSQPNGYDANVAERKRKRNETRLEGSFEKITKTTKVTNVKHRETIIVAAVGSKSMTKTQVRPLEKVQEPQLLAQMKNSTRQTRSSKRNVPKVNYIYTDGDSDCNPSGGGGGGGGGGGDGGVVHGSKRKRKKTNR